TLALDALAAAVERRQEADRGEATLDAQLHALETDRSRLAAELDDAAARARALEHANREVARRLDAAIDTIPPVPPGNGAEPPQRPAGPSGRRSVSPSTAASSAWPARTARSRISCSSPRSSTRASRACARASARSATPGSR